MKNGWLVRLETRDHARSKKNQIRALLKSIGTGDRGSVAVVNEARYIQHNPRLGDGVAALRSALEDKDNDQGYI